MNIKINVFDPASIDAAIEQLERTSQKLKEWGGQIAERLANIGYDVAYSVMAGNVYSGETISSLQVQQTGPYEYTLLAGSVALLFFEFGAGIQGVGHPEAGKFGMGAGTYPGQKHAFDPNGWWFPTDDANLAVKYDKDGQGWGHSYGNPPHMPMYQAETKMREELERVAREVIQL